MDLKKIVNPWTKVEGYSCPGCCPTNEKGLRLQFFEQGDYVLSEWMPDMAYQSWKNTLHGGIIALMLDEIAGWAVFRKLQTMGVTSRMDTRYHKPVVMTEKVTLKACITKQMRNVAIVQAEVWQCDVLMAEATATYFCASREKTVQEYGFEGCYTEDEL